MQCGIIEARLPRADAREGKKREKKYNKLFVYFFFFFRQTRNAACGQEWTTLFLSKNIFIIYIDLFWWRSYKFY